MSLLTDKMITDEFLADIRRDSFLPAVQTQWTDQKILDVAYDEVLSGVVAPLTQIDHSFYREISDITLVADQGEYDVPRYAMLGKIYTAYLVDTDGNIGGLHGVNPPENVHFNVTSSGHPWSIRIDGSQIVVNPEPSSTDIATWTTLRTFIYRRPGRLVRLATDGSNTGRCATVSGVAGTTVTYTGNTPTDFTSSSVHDFYSGHYPFRRIGSAVTATAKAAANTQGFSTANAALLSAGDYVCMRDETCVVPLPSHELLKPLRQLVIASIAASHGDKDAYKTALEMFVQKVDQLYPASSNRLQNNLATMTLRASPYLKALGRGRRMVRD